MSEPISNKNPNDNETGSKEVVHKPDEGDPIVHDFHATNRQRKRELLQSLAKGALFGTGKEMAEHFIEWFIS